MRGTKDPHSAPGTKGRVLHSAAGYDLLACLFLLGRQRGYRDTLIQLARLESGESVLDIGCGTGSLALAAKRRVGPSGNVDGLDASPAMVMRARKKARKADADVSFTQGVVEALPFQADQFDVVLSTLMLHHLPRSARAQCAHEIRRVLKPGGRVLVVDFGGDAKDQKSLLDHFHRRHGHVDVQHIVQVLREAGLEIIGSGSVGVRDLNFVLASA